MRKSNNDRGNTTSDQLKQPKSRNAPWRWISAMLLLIFATTSCRSPYYVDRGMAVGGLTGAGLGAVVGRASGDTTAGALIGSALGAVTGGVVGNEMDRWQAENRAMAESQLAQHTAAATVQDAVTMTRAGLGDEVIVNHIRAQGVMRPPTANDLIALKNCGVSDAVIRAMQEMGAVPPPSATVVPAAAPPVVVEEHFVDSPIAVPVPVWGPPACPYPVWRPPHYHARRGRPGMSWGVSISN